MGKIMIVDDSSTMRRIIKNTLSKLGFDKDTLIEAADGMEAWEIWQKEGDNIDLILLDWNMPNMNGYEFLKKVREDERKKGILGEGPQFLKDIKAGKGVKIVMVTTEGGKQSVIDAVKAGVNHYIVKPFQPKDLKEKLAALKMIEG
ncbi:MAG: response regulator [Epsilonproteobacteria bacterium]|nr:response regulator [Campylobacterota bacterium]